MAAQGFRRRLRSSESAGPPSPYLQWSRLKQTRDGAIKDDRLVSSSRRRVPRYEAGMLDIAAPKTREAARKPPPSISQSPSGPPETGSRDATSSMGRRSTGGLDSQETVSPVTG